MSYNSGYLYGSGSMDGSVEAWGDGETPKFDSIYSKPETEQDNDDEVEEVIEQVEPISSEADLDTTNNKEANDSKEEDKKSDGIEKKSSGSGFNLWLPFSNKTKSKAKEVEQNPDFKVVPKQTPKTSGLSHHFLYPKSTEKNSKTSHSNKGGSGKTNTIITDLDNETMFYLLNFLSVKSLLALKNSNRRFKYLVSQDRVWANRLKNLNYSKLDWKDDQETGEEEDSYDRNKPENMCKKLWTMYGRQYLQFRQLDGPQVYLELFQGADLAEMSKQLYRLTNLSKAKFVDSHHQIDLNLLIIREYYESSLLTNLNLAYTTMDLEELKTYSLALQGLEGNNLGIKWLIEQNPIFVYHNYTSPDSIDDLERIFLQIDQYFQVLFNEVQLENKLILKIFSNASEGNTVFLEQLIQGPLVSYLIPILDTAEEQSDMLPELYPQILIKTLESGLDLLTKCAEQVQIDSNRCQLALYNFFQPLLDSFVKNELLFLDLNYTTLTKSFLYQQFETNSTTKDSTGFFETFRKDRGKVFKAVTKVFTKPSYFSFNQRRTASLDNYDPSSLHQDAHFDDTDSHHPEHPNATSPTSPTSSSNSNSKPESNLDFSKFISQNLAQSMLQLNQQSLDRITKFLVFKNIYQCQRLVDNTVEQIFNRLISYLTGHHLTKGFDHAFQQLRIHQSVQFNSLETNGLVGPVLSFFDLIKVADLITNQLDHYFRLEITKYVDLNDFLDPSVIAKKRFETVVDGKVAEGLDLSIQTLMSHVHTLLKHHQLPTDFNKKGAKLESLQPTQACKEVVNCLILHVNLVKSGNLEPKILEVFYSEIALRLFNDLSKHIKAFNFDEQGGYQLLSDLSGYFSWVVTLDLPNVINHFQALKEVANLYLLSPENLKISLQDQERFLGIFHPEDLLEFVQRRTDYKKIQKFIEVEGCTVM